MLCTFYALPRLPLADVLTLTNVFPVWVAILSWPLLRERPSLNVLVAILLGIIGVALVEQPHFETRNWAAFFALLASVFTAVAMLGLHRLHQVAPMAVVMHFSAVSLIFVALAAFGFDSIHEQTIYFDDQVLSLLVGVGIFAAIGQLFLTKAFARGAPTKVAVVSLSHVVFAIAIDVFWWARQINAITYVGIILVVTPTAWLMVQSGKTNKEQNQ
jgi:drug/metabolite transporter (DMT)-like permease